MIKTLATLVLLSSLIGCSSTPNIVYLTPDRYEFTLAKPVPEVTVRVHPGDVTLYGRYVDSLKGRITFYEGQIVKYLGDK